MMTAPNLSTYENRMKSAISRAFYALQFTRSDDDDRKAIIALSGDLLRDVSYLIEELTGNEGSLSGALETVLSDIEDAFSCVDTGSHRPAPSFDARA
jgi:hypothetical protein